MIKNSKDDSIWPPICKACHEKWKKAGIKKAKAEGCSNEDCVCSLFDYLNARVEEIWSRKQ